MTDSLKKAFEEKLRETKHLKTNHEALPRDTLLAAKIMNDREHECVKSEFQKKLISFSVASLDSTNKRDVTPSALVEDEPKFCKMVQERAMKELSMKRHLELFGVTGLDEKGLSKVDTIKIFLLQNCENFPTNFRLISYRGYQNFRNEITEYFISENSNNCLWILRWFTVALFMKLCSHERRALVPVSLILKYIDEKLDFYFYRVEQLELGTTSMLSVNKIPITLAHVNALKNFSKDYINFVTRFESKNRARKFHK